MSTSRLTGSPFAAAPSVVRSSVSGISDTENQSPSTAATVSETPSTAIEPFSTTYRRRPGSAAIETIRAKPSSRPSRTEPRPSTWPCTTWPPRRSSARSGSSRFTRVPAPTSPSDERRSVSCITSAPKPSAAAPTAVRPTPLTATESPSRRSPASADCTRSRTPSSVASRATTVPRSAIRPVNTRSPLLEARGDEDVAGERLARERQRPQRVGDAVDALALERVARGPPAQHERRDEQADLVDRARVHERAREVRAALEQHARDGRVERAELVERRLHAGGLVLAGRDDDLGAGGLERVGRAARRGAGGDDDERHLGRLGDELRVERQARRRVEHDAARLAVDAVDAGRELRVVGERRPDPDGDRVERRAPAVRDGAAAFARDPLRVAALGGDLAVEAHRRLEDHERPPGARVLAEGLVLQPGAGGELAAGDDDVHALVAQDPETAPGGLRARVVAGDDDAREPG